MLLISYNTQFGRGRDGRYAIDRTAEAIEDGDIIALQEVERFWQRSGNIDQPMALSDRLPEHHWIYGPTIDTFCPDRDGAGRPLNRRRQWGNMILSRYPILSARNHLLPRFCAVNHHSVQRAALEAVIETPGGLLRVYSTHLCHLSRRQRLIQIERLKEIHRNAPLEGPTSFGPHPDPSWAEAARPPCVPKAAVILGDFNFRPDSREYEKAAAETDPVRGPLYAPDGFADAWRIANPAEMGSTASEDDGATLYADWTRKTGIRIDYCLVSTDMISWVQSAEVDGTTDASDHQPLRIRVEPTV